MKAGYFFQKNIWKENEQSVRGGEEEESDAGRFIDEGDQSGFTSNMKQKKKMEIPVKSLK